MNTRASLLLLAALAAPMTACGGSDTTANAAQADTGVVVDTGTADAVTDAAPPMRTMVQNPLFGDMHAQNLVIDTNFTTRQPGVGDWLASTNDNAVKNVPTYTTSLMSDAPVGIASYVAQLADATASKGNFELSLAAQVPGGPGPFEVRVWLSTLDPAASAKLIGAAVDVLTEPSTAGTTIAIHEDPTQAKVLGGRTWHLYEGTVNQDLPLLGFVVFDFQASKNTWLVQAPSFVPTALLPSGATTKKKPLHPAATPRPQTDRERQIVRRYVTQPRISVPAWHPSITERPAGERLP